MLMKLTKKSALMAAVLVMASSFGVWAACGDSICGNYGGEFTCFVTNSDGVLEMCTAGSPCHIRC
jgi:hypothetical protein